MREAGTSEVHAVSVTIKGVRLFFFWPAGGRGRSGERTERMSGGAVGGASSCEGQAPWERRLEEGPKAYAAFRVFLELGANRSFVAAARQLGKSESLLRRWADRHGWRERAWQYDLSRDREAEALARQELAETMKRQLQDAEHFQNLAKKGVSELVVRDPTSGRLRLAKELDVADSDRLYRLGLQIQRQWLGQRGETTREGEGGEELELLSVEELRELIALARERAAEQRKKENQDGGDDRKPQASK